jgi:hypothetical protein
MSTTTMIGSNEIRNLCAWLDEIPETTRITYINPCQLAQLLQITWSLIMTLKLLLSSGQSVKIATIAIME